jgi:hypothetical protein
MLTAKGLARLAESSEVVMEISKVLMDKAALTN